MARHGKRQDFETRGAGVRIAAPAPSSVTLGRLLRALGWERAAMEIKNRPELSDDRSALPSPMGLFPAA